MRVCVMCGCVRTCTFVFDACTRVCICETHTHRRVGVDARAPTSSVGPAGLQAGCGDTVARLGGEGEEGQAAGPVLRPTHPTLLQARHNVPHRQTPGAVGWGPLKVKERGRGDVSMRGLGRSSGSEGDRIRLDPTTLGVGLN